MMPPLAPVQAAPAQAWSSGFESVEIDPELAHEIGSSRGKLDIFLDNPQEPSCDHAVEEPGSDISREVIVADAGLSQRGVFGTWPRAQMARARGEAHQCLESPCDLVTREREILVSSLPMKP